MNPQIYSLPLDKEGVLPSNKVNKEYHSIAKYGIKPYKIIVLQNGYFFADSVVLYDNMYKEIPRTSYQFVWLHSKLTAETGKRICACIVIKDPTVSNFVYVDAQMVGDVYTNVADAVHQFADSVLNDTRAIDWNYLEDKPDAYRPSGHLHPLWEWYGFDPWTASAKRVEEALLTKSRMEIDGYYSELERKYSELEDRRNAILEGLVEHVNDKDDPHKLTSAQVDLQLVANYPIADLTIAGIPGNPEGSVYGTPASIAAMIKANYGDIVEEHHNNKNNPHNVTPHQAGTYTRNEILQFLVTRLNKGGTAYNSYRIDGRLHYELFYELRAELPTSAVTIGRFNAARLGIGTANGQSMLVNDNGTIRWVNIANYLAEHSPPGPYTGFVGYQGTEEVAEAFVKATYGNLNQYPSGTRIFYTAQTTFSGYNGNGTHIENVQFLRALIRTQTGWIGPI